jgi:hypothetical protein
MCTHIAIIDTTTAWTTVAAHDAVRTAVRTTATGMA